MAGLRNTAPGLDGVSTHMLKLGGQPVVMWMHRIITAVWQSGTAPRSWKRAQLVPIYKEKGNPLMSDNYRGVTLLEVCGKAYVAVIHNRIRQHLCSQLLDAQHGFRPGRGTAGALFSVRRLQELARDWGAPAHAAFVDFRKAFDSINREALWRLLEARGVAPKLVSLIRDLYDGCEACVMANGETSPWFPMGQVDCQDSFVYLGSLVHASGQQEAELSRRLAAAGAAFQQLWPRVFNIRGVSLATKVRIYKAVVVPTLLYGAAESWALGQAQQDRLDAFNATCLRRILGVQHRHPAMMRNAEVYAATQHPALSDLLRKHRLRWLGHVARMQDSTSVKQLLFSTASRVGPDRQAGVQRRVQGAPAMAYTRVLLSDVQSVLTGTGGMPSAQAWYQTSLDRTRWKGIVSNCGTVG